MEDLVGRAVRKAFPGFGVFSGVVESYDAQAGYFRVLYEDGDSEEVDGDEMGSILVGAPMPPQPETPGGSAGRRPKKRRRGDEESARVDVYVVAEAIIDGDGLANGDVLATPTARRGGGENGEVMAQTTEKKRRVDPGSESSRPVRRSARQAKAAALAAEMEAAANVAAAAEAAESPTVDAVSPVPVAAVGSGSVQVGAVGIARWQRI